MDTRASIISPGYLQQWQIPFPQKKKKKKKKNGAAYPAFDILNVFYNY
jgi:hypothetical protein